MSGNSLWPIGARVDRLGDQEYLLLQHDTEGQESCWLVLLQIVGRLMKKPESYKPRQTAGSSDLLQSEESQVTSMPSASPSQIRNNAGNQPIRLISILQQRPLYLLLYEHRIRREQIRDTARWLSAIPIDDVLWSSGANDIGEDTRFIVFLARRQKSVPTLGAPAACWILER